MRYPDTIFVKIDPENGTTGTINMTSEPSTLIQKGGITMAAEYEFVRMVVISNETTVEKLDE